jgi:hypothetical protein
MSEKKEKRSEHQDSGEFSCWGCEPSSACWGCTLGDYGVPYSDDTKSSE